jgi:hypothetical protein
LRSLLHTVLKHHTELIPVVLPERWTLSQEDVYTLAQLDTEPFTLSELKQAFKLLIEQTTGPLKLCFLIDGLDEYDGDYDTILELFNDIASFPNIKVCLSSRPLLVFEDAFSSGPGLRLQDLTRPDIERFVDDKLHNNQKFMQLAQDEPERAPALIHEIVMKADGVFLWVALVVKSLLAGLGNRDGILDLQKRLRILPSDLEALYQHMLMSRIEPFYLTQASQIFQIIRAAREIEEIEKQNAGLGPLTVLDLSFAMDSDTDLAITAEISPSSEEAISTRCRVMDDRLKSRCAGLIEIGGLENAHFSASRKDKARIHGRVQYLHRTVRDYLEKPDVWQILLARTSRTEFNPNLALLKSCILRLKLVSIVEPLLVGSVAMLYAHRADAQTKKGNVALLNELDRTVTYCSNMSGMTEYWGSHKWQKSILSFAVQYGLHEYVYEILSKNEDIILSSGKPLLFYAVDPIPSKQRYPLQLSQRMVAILLAHGADPNSKFNGGSPWDIALRLCSFLEDEANPAFSREVAAILQILLQHGADPYAYVSTDKGQQPARTAVMNLIQQHVPAEASNLEQCWKTAATLERRIIIETASREESDFVVVDSSSIPNDVAYRSKWNNLSSLAISKATDIEIGSVWTNISSLQIFRAWRPQESIDLDPDEEAATIGDKESEVVGMPAELDPETAARLFSTPCLEEIQSDRPKPRPRYIPRWP